MNTITVKVRGMAPNPWSSDKGVFEVMFDGGGSARPAFV